MLECISTETGANPVGTVIWMHGLGADATDFEPIVPMLELRQPLRFVFPNAPVRPITINGGAEMRGWYDIDPGAPLAGTEDINQSCRDVAEVI
ncbi:MAG: carboxylesterase, partial [Gammaproteobacteria bacterium]|nr:carboxylesterase [Gammaproteobacteria bacterium]